MKTGSEGQECAEVVEGIRRERSLEGSLERFPSGSVPVFAVGDEHVVKLFPPTDRSWFDTERATLEHIEGRLPVPTPRLIGSGESGPWSYVVMTRLPGRSMAEAWPTIASENRISLMREAGAALAALHAILADQVASTAIDWPRFMAAQRASCRANQNAKGLAAPWVEALDGFLARWAPADEGPRVLLHTEVMREHFLVDRRDGAWRLSGLLDFEDALLGAPEYELAAVGIFLAAAEPGLLRAFLDAYGASIDDELPLRIMAYALLHRHSNLRWYLERLPAPDVAGDLEALARRWFRP
ncbi:MAG TPA: aminoglycoside 3'-phosphotransferase/choline kinase family protein [Candidatus Binatia bacterium]|nr:aminoglycoside 3'-phosphotransferase/choline kinase family protein [Candidatus Binatia bacterium]